MQRLAYRIALLGWLISVSLRGGEVALDDP